MKLHSYYRSSTSYRVRIALNLKGCEYDIVAVNLLQGAHREQAYLDINPAGTVPTLQWQGEYYSQSLAIMALLEERLPSPSLWPTKPRARAKAREWAMAIASEAHAPNNLNRLNYLRSAFNTQDDDIKAWYADVIHHSFAPLETRLGQWYDNQELALSALPFDTPGAFEAVLIPQLYNARRFGVDLDSYPHIRAIEEHCLMLEPFIQAAPENQPDAR